MASRFSLGALSFVAGLLGTALSAQTASAQRVLGLDVSGWQGNLSQSAWNTAFGSGNRKFAFLRATRGGTTGYDHRNDGLVPGSAYSGSQRYDDPYFGQNITRATAAGMFTGSYHFARPNILATTTNSNGTTVGVANNGTDEANHMIQMAGAWMRPGYLLPTFDLEAGSGSTHLAQFSLDFSNRIYSQMGIRPAMYINGNYSSIVAGASSSLRNQLAQPASHGGPSVVSPAYSVLWNARYPNESNPNSIPVQTGSPKNTPSTLNSFYGPWDDYGNAHPWSFWQYASTVVIPGMPSGGIDGNVAQGDIEFVKDKLVPAVWMNNSSGNWSTLSNWNSGQTAAAPVVAPNQSPVQGTYTLPAARLPGAAVAGPTTGLNDTVILERPSANITVTVNSGTHNVRKLYMRESLVVSGGSLTVNYNPNYVSDTATYPNALRSGPISAQFSGPATLSGSGAINIHTLQVDAVQTFTVNGGSLLFDKINLMPHASTPAKIQLAGNLNVTPLGSATATIANGTGGGSSGLLNLGGATRSINVANGSAGVDLAINVPITNGSITKTGAGTLALSGSQAYAGDTTVSAGTLRLTGSYFTPTARVSVASGSSLSLNYSGSQNFIDELVLGGVTAANGTWGSPTSGAQFTSSLLSGNGWLSVGPPPGPGNVIDNFEVDEGHFISAYNTSPQTVGLTSATTINRVTSQPAQSGPGCQELNLVASGGAWTLRHNSGFAGGVANPSGNEPLDPSGYVGFWLRTNETGITVQIAIDDPTGANPTALERGVAQAVIADNQWHLYQWDFDDAADWDAFAGGADGDIDGALGSVSIDSIFFSGSGSAQIYLDTVSHNPDGVISAAAAAAVPEPSVASLLAMASAALAMGGRRSR